MQARSARRACRAACRTAPATVTNTTTAARASCRAGPAPPARRADRRHGADAGGLDAHERGRAHHASSTSADTVSARLCSERMRDCARRSMVPQRLQCAVMPGAERRHGLEQPATRAFAQVRPDRSGRPGPKQRRHRALRARDGTAAGPGKHRREPVGELADRGADRRDLAPMPAAGGGTTKRKLRVTGSPCPCHAPPPAPAAQACPRCPRRALR